MNINFMNICLQKIIRKNCFRLTEILNSIQSGFKYQQSYDGQYIMGNHINGMCYVNPMCRIDTQEDGIKFERYGDILITPIGYGMDFFIESRLYLPEHFKRAVLILNKTNYE